MTYWDLVVKEVLNKGLPGATYRFTHRVDPPRGGGNSGDDASKKRGLKKKSFALGPKFPEIKFSLQESRCMYEALKGKTIPKIGVALNLSERTVEYYFEKMRLKTKCKTKSELIEKISETDFLKNYVPE